MYLYKSLDFIRMHFLCSTEKKINTNLFVDSNLHLFIFQKFQEIKLPFVLEKNVIKMTILPPICTTLSNQVLYYNFDLM